MTTPDTAWAAADGTDTLSSIGEVAVLRRIFPRLPNSDAALLGPGDDAAILSAPDGRYVVTTDMMVHGPDFRWAWSTPDDLGWKAAASNLADVAAMGARPTALLVAIAAPGDTAVAVLEGIADGLRAGCEALAPGCGVVGGDLSVSDVFTIAVTAFGDLQGARPVLRSGARPSDVIAVAGSLGAAARGLHELFERGVDENGVPDLTRSAELRTLAQVRAQLRPSPPIASGVEAAGAGATAMLDVSDGLALDAGRIAAASGVALDLDSEALHAVAGDDLEPAMTGGEDHALLAAFPPEAVLPAGFRTIGTVRAGKGVLVDGEPYVPDDSRRAGWDPYAGWDGQSG
jgi:thiamine-monophosphate kinase